MPAFDRNRWKAATEIAAALSAGQHVSCSLTVPTRPLSRLQELAANLELAQQRQWSGAAAQPRDLFHRTLWQLQAEVTLLLQEHPRRERQPQSVRPADIYRELTGLLQEFPAVELDLRGQDHGSISFSRATTTFCNVAATARLPIRLTISTD